MGKRRFLECVMVILIIVITGYGGQVLQTDAGMVKEHIPDGISDKKQELKVYADVKDKTYDGTTDAELINIHISEDTLLEQDKTRAEEIISSIVAEGRFYKVCADQKDQLSVGVQVSASFKANSQWYKKYELVPVDSTAVIHQAKLSVQNVKIKDKVYDREKAVQVTWNGFEVEGKLGTGDDREDIKKNIEVRTYYEDFHAGENKKAEIKASFRENSGYACKYKLEVKGFATGTIKPKPVRLLVSGDYEVCYSDFDLKEMQDKIKIKVDENDLISGDDISVFDSELPKADLMDEVPRFKGQPCMTSSEGLQVIGIAVKEPGREYTVKDHQFERRITGSDYKFVFSKENCKWLHINQEQINIQDYIKVSEKSVQACLDQEEPGKFWIGNKEKAGILYLEPAENEEGKYYRAVVSDKKGNLTKDGISSDQVVGESFSIYLVPQEPDNGLHTDGKAISGFIDISVNKDIKAPDVKIQMGITDTAVTKTLEQITFGVYSRQVMRATILADDRQSGTVNVKYAFYQIKKDESIAGEEEQKQFLSKLTWKELNYQKGVPMVVNNYVESQEKQLNYILVVKAKDSVGNCKAYCSNGVVIDIQEPVIDLTLTSNNPVSSSGIYRSDVKISIRVKEPSYKSNSEGVVLSGIKFIKYKIYMDGIKEEEGTLMETEAKEVSLRKLQEDYGEFTEEIIIKAERYNSNDIRIDIIAGDQAGNEQTESRFIKIDKTHPTADIFYSSVVKAENDIYYRENRTAMVTIRERNFDSSAIRFRLKKENTNMGEYTLEQLNRQLGIHAKWQDSQAWKEETCYTDKRTNIAVITFDKDDAYTFDLICADDKAGNTISQKFFRDNQKNVKANTHFVIDKTAPVIRITYTAGGKNIIPGSKESKRIYKNKTVSAHIYIKEHNFALTEKEVGIKALLKKERNKAGTKVKNVDKLLKKASLWGSNKDYRSVTIDFKEDSNYTFGVEYKDLAGNKVISKETYFTVDKTPPTGTITVGTLGEWKKFVKHITFDVFANKIQQVTLTGKDATSPVKRIAYYKSDKPLAKSEVKRLKNKKWINKTIFNMKYEGEAVIYGKIEDKAGNIGYISSNGVVLDTTKPAPAIEIRTAQPVHGVFSGDVRVQIYVEDQISGNTYAGLQSVSYEVFNGTSVTQRGDFDLGVYRSEKKVKEITKSITVDARKNNSNNVAVKVTAIDQAGNQSSKVKKLKIDITRPEVTVIYQNNSTGNGNYYKETREAVITVKEQNFDPDNVQFLITNTEEGRPAVSPWRSSKDDTNSDEPIHKCTVSFDGDGDYTFTLTCGDLAGNYSSYERTDTFTIDKTEPEIQVTYDNNQAYSENYYDTPRTATVTIREHNFKEKDVKVTITASLGKQKIKVPVISHFNSHGDQHSATIFYEKDGNYTFSIYFTDQAGNAAVFAEERFVIDTQAPKVEIKGVNKSNKGVAAPVIEYTDENYNPEKAEITLSGCKHEPLRVKGSVSPITNGERIQLKDFKHMEDVDDIYTLTAKVKDRAGNSSEKNFTFSVNRFGSVYVMDEYMKGVLEQYFINSVNDLIITERNTDNLKFRQITCSKNGKVMELEDGIEYQTEEKGSDPGWKIYKYVIDKKNFMEDGKYVVTIYTEDQANNISSNQAKGKPIEFVVDKTPPTLVITGAKNGKQYKEDSHEISIDVKDNIQLESVRIESQADGENTPLISEYTKEELKECYGIIQKSISSSNQWQTIKISAVDSAGNVTHADEIRILITSNIWVQFYMNKTLFLGTVAGIVTLLGFTIWQIKRKDNKLAGL